MSIVFSAIVPHSPFLIPAIGKENLEKLKKTEESFKKLEGDLYSSKAETIIIISPHGHMTESFSLNLSPEFNGVFEEFGDMVTKFKLSGDVGLAHKIKEHLEIRANLQLITEEKLDYGSGVPLYLLTRNMPKVKIIPLYYSEKNLVDHFEFGRLLKRELAVSDKRIAVIASGDLSHKLSEDAPGGFSPKAKKFDEQLIENLKKKKIKDILKIKKSALDEVAECGLKSILILLGILDEIKYDAEVLSYEYPFGVGYLTMQLKL